MRRGPRAETAQRSVLASHRPSGLSATPQGLSRWANGAIIALSGSETGAGDADVTADVAPQPAVPSWLGIGCHAPTEEVAT